MKLHTNLRSGEIYDAMHNAHEKYGVSVHVNVADLVYRQSRSHERAFDIQLGANVNDDLPLDYVDQHGKRMRKRRTRNSGNSGTFYGLPPGPGRYAATWHEWGHFMSEVFKMDPDARFDRVYDGAEDFHEKTNGEFR